MPGDENMADDNKSTGFWGSFAGALTAAAAVITAITGLIIALRQTPPQTTGGSLESPKATISRPQRTSPESPTLVRPVSDYRVQLQSKQNNGDSVRIISISPPPGTQLSAGRDTPMNFRLGYTLKSSVTAMLFVQIAQFDHDPSSGCGGSGHIPDAMGTKINAGQGEVSVDIIWHGGVSKANHPSGGSIAPTFSIWDANRQDIISSFPVVEEACYHFSS
jgi:hypothetical protein